jgi:HEXXH motif-containing protein
MINRAVASLATQNSTLLIRTEDKEERELDWLEIDRYGRFVIPGCPIAFWQASDALRRIIAKYQRDLSRIHEDVLPFRLVTPAEFENSAYGDRFSAGLALIGRCWPELHAETCVLTDYFTVIQGIPFIGGSAISCLGTSFFKLLPEWSDLCFADHIVHEAAHQRLHVEFELEPALTNGDFTATISPIRRDPRPLHGVFHASFVFLRLAQFMERVIEWEYTLEAESRFHRHLLGLYRGLEQLDRYAKWSARGAQFFSLMCQTADRLRSVIPRPDPKHYNRLGPDYEPVSALAAAYHD